jgi:hypothetical protein
VLKTYIVHANAIQLTEPESAETFIDMCGTRASGSTVMRGKRPRAIGVLPA